MRNDYKAQERWNQACGEYSEKEIIAAEQDTVLHKISTNHKVQNKGKRG
jgi:hypothetical protein